MADHRVRVPALTPRMTLGPREARHLQVLRLRPGDAVRVFDGQGAEAGATVEELDEGRAVLALGERMAGAAETPQPVTLAVALLKGDKLADVVRATTVAVRSVSASTTAFAPPSSCPNERRLACTITCSEPDSPRAASPSPRSEGVTTGLRRRFSTGEV